MDFSLFIPNIIRIWEEYWQVFLLQGLKNTLILTCISVSLEIGRASCRERVFYSV